MKSLDVFKGDRHDFDLLSRSHLVVLGLVWDWIERAANTTMMTISVAPIQALMVPNGCSAVWHRMRMVLGARSSRSCIASRTASCSQRLTRCAFEGVHFDFSAQAAHFVVQLQCSFIERYLSVLETSDRQGGELAKAKSARLKDKIASLREQMRS
jgi:hypothetical protein